MDDNSKHYFWKHWKRKSNQEVKYGQSLEKALIWIKEQPFINEVISMYVKASFVNRELNKKSDIDLVLVVKNEETSNLVRVIRDKNKDWLKPVELLPIGIEELINNERFKKPVPGKLQGRPDHFTILLPYHKLVYGKPLNPEKFKIRTERKIYGDLKQAIEDQFIPLYEAGELGFTQLIKQVSHLIYWEERLKGKAFSPTWKEIKKASINNELFQRTFYLRFHPTKNKRVRSKYIIELKEYLK